jgi:CRP-like cAMP-binding protein
VPAKAKTKKITAPTIDVYVTNLLAKISEGKQLLNVRKGEKIFAQGDKAAAIFFIESGKVKLSVASTAGKDAILAILGPRTFFGEGALIGHSLRMSSATATEGSTVFSVDKIAMVQALHEQSDLSEKFMAGLLTRNIDLEEDLCDQLFNHSEKRLARVLLKLSRLRQTHVLPNAKIPSVKHETLAEMVGTTRSRITYFMNKFRKLGLIEYNGEILVRTELLTDVVLHDS